MACLRGISKRVNLLQRRVYPTFGHRFGDDKDETKPVSSPNPSTMVNKFFLHIGTERLGSVFLERQYKSFVQPLGFGLSSCRYMSSTPAEVPDKVDSIALVGTEVVPDEILESVTSEVAPAIDEVALAAADSILNNNLAASFINDVHSITGLNWWASISLTSLIISGLTLPTLLYVTKAFHKPDTLRLQLEHLRQEISTWVQVSDPEAMTKEFEKHKKILYKKFGVNVAAFLSLIVIQGGLFVIFDNAVMDMVKTVPSFKTGGILWFTDLTTRDSLCILPLLIPMNFWILMQLYFPNDLKGLLKARNADKILIGVLVPLSLFLPSATFFIWLPTQMACIVYGLATKEHFMQKK